MSQVISIVGQVNGSPDQLMVLFEDRSQLHAPVLRVYDAGLALPDELVLSAPLGVGGVNLKRNEDLASDAIAFAFVEVSNRVDVIGLSNHGLRLVSSYEHLPTLHRTDVAWTEDFAVAGSWLTFSSGFWLQWTDGTRCPRLPLSPTCP